jgi:hypothetical protein
MRFVFAIVALCLVAPCYAARPLKEDTAVTIVVGPFVDTAGTAVTAPTIASIDITAYKNDGTAVTITPAASGSSNDMAHVDDGYFSLELTTTDTSTAGYLRLTFQISGALIFHEDFEVQPANIYDSFFGADKLDVSVVQWLGTAAATPTTAGVPEVDVTHVEGAASTIVADLTQLLSDTTDILTFWANTPTMAESVAANYAAEEPALTALATGQTTLSTLISDVPTNAELNLRTLLTAQYATAAAQSTGQTTLSGIVTTLGTPDDTIAADIAGIDSALGTPVSADVVGDSYTWFGNRYRATNIVEVEGGDDGYAGPLALAPDMNPGVTIATVDEVSIVGPDVEEVPTEVTATNLSVDRSRTRAVWTVPELTVEGTYEVRVRVTTVENQQITTVGTMKVY